MKGKLILDRTESCPGGNSLFVFEHTDENGKIRFLTYPGDRIPVSLRSTLRQGDILTAEWDENAILTGMIEKEETSNAARQADDLLARLFAKGNKK